MASTIQDSTGDGRVQRGARNRKAIAEALFELVEAGDLVPTAEKVAQRAGVGTRTVFRHFEDMDSLFAELHVLLEREIRPLVDSPVPEGDLNERASALARRRAQLFERISPFKRASQIQKWRSSFLQKGQNEMVRRLRADLMKAIPELEGAPESLREAVDLLTSFEAWDRLRCEQRLGRDRAEAVVHEGLVALLASLA